MPDRSHKNRITSSRPAPAEAGRALEAVPRKQPLVAALVQRRPVAGAAEPGEIPRWQKLNLVKAKSFRDLLKQTLQRYDSRIIDAAEFEASDARTKLLGFTDDELDFYDAVCESCETVYQRPFLRELVHQVVQAIKKDLKVDWTEAHCENVRVSVRAAAKRILRCQRVTADDFYPFIEKFMVQAKALYAEWQLAA